MNPAPAATITLSAEPIVAAIQIVAVLAYPEPRQSQRAANLLLAWHRERARATGLEREHPGMSPARLYERLDAVHRNLRRRFEAGRWALMLATRDTSIQIRFDGARKMTLRGLARWRGGGEEPNVIRPIWTASEPILAMAMAARAQFDREPTIEELCFSSEWVAGALDAEPLIAWALDAFGSIEYSVAKRVGFIVPDMIQPGG